MQARRGDRRPPDARAHRQCQCQRGDPDRLDQQQRPGATSAARCSRAPTTVAVAARPTQPRRCISAIIERGDPALRLPGRLVVLEDGRQGVAGGRGEGQDDRETGVHGMTVSNGTSGLCRYPVAWTG